MAYCQGTPLRNEIEARCGQGGMSLAKATVMAAQAIAFARANNLAAREAKG